MAQDNTPKRQIRRHKPSKTVRELTEEQPIDKYAATKKIRGRIFKPLSVLNQLAKKEFNLVPMPKNKVGRILGKRVHIMPKFIRESWAELKLVTWSSRREAARLTMAVIIFAAIFAIFVQVLGILFDKLVKIFLLK